MTTDLSGGLDPSRERVFDAPPPDPEMRESVNVWMWDDGLEVGFPRIGVEAVADQWDTHDVGCTIALADGRVLGIYGPGAVHDPTGSDGTPRVLGAGPLSFELVRPFRHWKVRLDGLAVVTNAVAQIEGRASPEVDRVEVRLDIDVRHVVPPWEQGALLPEAGRVLAEQEEGALMGGRRYEQLFRATGTFSVDGDERTIDGGGLRIRRRGVRRIARFWGHVWQSSVFPDGRAFGCLIYPPRDDGKPTFDEGFVFDGDGPLVPARVVDAPWLRRLAPSGQDVTVTLQAVDGRTVTIAGRTELSAFLRFPVSGEGEEYPVLQQAVVRYELDGQVANGMIERSSLPRDMDDR